MKILSIISNGYPIIGGAQLANIAYLKTLSKRFDHECSIFTNFDKKIKHRYGKVKLETFRDLEELRAMTGVFHPDVIIASSHISHYAVKLAKKLGVPSLIYMQDYSYCSVTPREQESWQIGGPNTTKEGREFVMQEADMVCCVSYALQKRFWKEYKIHTPVLYCPFEPNSFLLEKPPIQKENLSFIMGTNCLWPHKGADIFLELCRIFPNEKFLIPLADIDHLKHRELEDKRKMVMQGKWERNFRKARKLRNLFTVPFDSMKRYLKMSKIVLVPSQWPEPFGRVAVEAMANGIPTLASYTGGLKEITGDSSLAVRKFQTVDEWAKKIKKLLFEEKSYLLNRSEGLTLSKKFLGNESSMQLEKILRTLAKNKKKPDLKKNVALLGHDNKKSAYSVINSAWDECAKKDREYTIFGVKNFHDFLPVPIDYHIHHDYSNDFKKITLPEEGKFIFVRSWDFGKFPPALVKKINAECDQLWVHTKWIQKKAIESGIIEERVKIVPLGVDGKIFHPNGPQYPLATKKKFKFIFVGGAVKRKGIDILLKAYKEAFSPEDNVSLVIKDNASNDPLYKNITLKKKILNMVKDKRCPEIIYIDEFLPTSKLADLYRACNVGVFPYRAEGFALPIVESLACGVPVIVPRFGACLDFCNDANSFLMPVKEIRVPVGQDFVINNKGDTETIEEVHLCEISKETLSDYMKKIVSLPVKDLTKKGLRGARKVKLYFQWANSFKAMKQHLKDLEKQEVPVRLLTTRDENFHTKEQKQILEAAGKMFPHSRQKERN
ncbi:MAG: glycosyltransferase [Candidatus Pacebacteria bacterium]|nr:glycosyltransferase [Candidatus Paceibacterota bacterium]MDD5357048.1 glycosyltransferase [Candidatus Paceibacterota bacterium]